MFTGIVQSACEVVKVDLKPGLRRFCIALPENLRKGIENGASIAVDGVCLTVTGYSSGNAVVEFDAMQETLSLTSLGDIVAGSIVNVERSATLDKELGGHIVSGHIDGTCEVVAIEDAENNRSFTYRYPHEFDKYLFKKGFVSLNGCSLTIADIDHQEHTLKVCYIPETLEITTHGLKTTGDRINLEIERQTQAVVDTVERIMAARDLAH